MKHPVECRDTNQDCRDDESLVSEAVDQLRVRLGEVPREVCPVVLVPRANLDKAKTQLHVILINAEEITTI